MELHRQRFALADLPNRTRETAPPKQPRLPGHWYFVTATVAAGRGVLRRGSRVVDVRRVDDAGADTTDG